MGVVKNMDAVTQQEKPEQSSDRPTEVRDDGSIDSSGGASSKLDSNHSSSDDKSHSSPSSATSGPSSTNMNKDGILVSQQERSISGARFLFLFLLMGAAAALGTTVYFITKNNDTTDFTSSFGSAGSAEIDVVKDKIDGTIEAMESLALSTTTFILQEQLEYKNQSFAWPPGFVTMPDCEHIFGRTKELSHALLLGYTPTVMAEDYERWSQYAELKKDWVVDAFRANPRNDFQTADPFSKFVDEPYIPDIWNLTWIDEDGDKILYNSSECTSDVVVPSGVEIVPTMPESGAASPIWMVTPPPNPAIPSRINYNLRSDSIFNDAMNVVAKHRRSAFQDFCSFSRSVTLIVTPVFGSFEEDAPIVGHLFAFVPWAVFFHDERKVEAEPMHVDVESSCGQIFSFDLDEVQNATLKDEEGDEEGAYVAMGISTTLAEESLGVCHYTLTIYPTAEYEDAYTSQKPLYYMLVVLFIFIGTSVAFLIFDFLVQKRQKTLVTTARKQNALVSSLFPKSIQKKLLEDLEDQAELNDAARSKPKWNKSGTAGLRSYLNVDGGADQSEALGGTTSLHSSEIKTKPIADLFPETTIMFADIAGFTAWSSTREPSQVFTLLESIYHEFDMIAKRRRVFKVEVVGDCYVAVCGLPDPRRDHAVVMAKFASDCLGRMYDITRRLEVELGPDTTELGLRVGIHSGPVVAGVLRGDKSRFQLFGDTMNTTARMESTGTPNRIQVSQETANLLIAAGKKKWVTLRETKVEAKGKGELTTYWLNLSVSSVKHHETTASSSGGSVTDGSDVDDAMLMADLAAQEEKRNRVAEWTVEVLSAVLRTMVRGRTIRKVKPDSAARLEQLERETLSHSSDTTVIDEVAGYIILPDYTKDDKLLLDGDEAILDKKVSEELRNYVQTIAGLYNDNPFHNFDHANHVVMSVNKLLSRINAPDLHANNEELHDHTYGINSDPLTWFAVAFAALIHDVDHPGVPNSQLVREGAPVAELYHNKSVAEQNSFDIAWDLLMEPAYKNLRGAIYVTSAEFRRFRQLVINTIMATDIIDKDLKRMQNIRWEKAFDSNLVEGESHLGAALKATIVIEHLIQASDVSHTMQHWHVYRRWNERFFQECYHAYKQGRAVQNPADTWYEGEKGFFDFYIIPLAKKLKECGVFGVSSDEYLSYAVQNRQEWEERGQELVTKMVETAEAMEKASRGKSDSDGHDDTEDDAAAAASTNGAGDS